MDRNNSSHVDEFAVIGPSSYDEMARLLGEVYSDHAVSHESSDGRSRVWTFTPAKPSEPPPVRIVSIDVGNGYVVGIAEVAAGIGPVIADRISEFRTILDGAFPDDHEIVPPRSKIAVREPWYQRPRRSRRRNRGR